MSFSDWADAPDDDVLARIDRILFLGHDPARVLHEFFGTGAAAHFFSFVYIAWIVLVPASLVVALVWFGSIVGLGALGYLLALDAAAHLCKGAGASQAKSQIQ